MTTLQEIKSAVKTLPHQEYIGFLNWAQDKVTNAWDEQLEADAKSGKLDFLAEEALLEKQKNKLSDI